MYRPTLFWLNINDFKSTQPDMSLVMIFLQAMLVLKTILEGVSFKRLPYLGITTVARIFR